MGTKENVKVEPMNVTWGEDTPQVQTITCIADVADALDGDYFFIYTALNAIKYHVWFNTSGGAAVDPAPGGSTAVVVALTTGDTASAVATAVASALDGLAGFVATANGPIVTVTNASAGYASQAHEGVGTGFSFALTTEGDTAADVGYIDGDTEFLPEENLLEVTAQQTGSNVLTEIRTGKSVELTLNFQETSSAQLRKLFRQGGGSFVPAGAGGTEVTGMGTYKDFTQTTGQAKKVTLHPVRLAAADKSEDFTIMLGYPKLDSLAFSGENKMVVPLTFKCYPKTTLNSRVQYFAYGDGSQTLT